jgi:TP901 family phage tail tape measure protein
LATEFAVDLVFKSQGLGALDGAAAKLKGIEAAGTGAANGIKPIGPAAARSAVGVKTLGAAFNAALGPIGAAVAAIGGLTQAFQTLSAQNFAEAKVRTLGTDSAALVTELKKVSAELNGQASVAELTGAAYDVASAGFVKAADAAMVLKAASLGATGGFSDINTVGNAATSVLNAYGLAASEAGLVVDRFIQTQNDGKIVVAEYATNIGKVAAAAAGLGIPLEQVNAVIAQATASGVQAEVAFTGLKSALARLASGDAAKELEGFGIKISAASIESDGLFNTLKKLEGLDTGTLFKVLGTEAAPALLPVIQNLERFDELIKKQEGSAGAAAAAQKEAANTIQGAWKAVSTEFENLFSDQSELGIVIIATLKAAAAAVQIFGQTLNVLLAPIKGVITAFAGIASAVDKAFDISGKVEQANSSLQSFQEELIVIKDELLTDLAAAFEPVVELWGQAMDAIAGLWSSTTQSMGEAATGLGNWIQGVWNSIANGAQNIIAPITNAFSTAFNAAWGIVQNFWNSLPGWLKGALSAAGSVVGGVTSAVTKALGSVGSAIQKGIAGAGKAAAGLKAPAAIQYKAPAAGGGAAPAGGGSDKKKGGGGGGGAKERESQVPQLTQELALKQKLFGLEQQLQAAKLAGDKVAELSVQKKIVEAELDGKIAAIQLQKLPAQEKGLKVELARLEATEKLAELEFKTAEKENQRKERLQEMLTGFTREIELAALKTEEAKKLLEIEHKILDLKKDGLLTTDAEIAQYRERAQAAATAAPSSGQDQAKSDAQSISSSITGGLKDAIKAAITGGDVKQALAGMLSNIGDRLLDIAMRPLEEMLTKSLTNMFSPQQVATQANTAALMQLTATLQSAAMTGAAGGAGGFNPLGILGSVFGVAGGGFGGGAFGAGFNPLSTTPLFSGGIFEGGGYTGNAPRAGGMDGKGGFPAILHPGETVTDHRGSAARKALNGGNGDGGGGAPSMTLNVTATQIADDRWVKVDDLDAAMNKAARQGAAMGTRQTMDRLRQSPNTRRQLGI